MHQDHFKAQMNRLAAAYRVDIPAETRAAYWLAFGQGDDARFAAACEQAIAHERTFPPIAALKELIRQHHEIAHAESAMLSTGTVGCLTCMDAGFVRLDVPVAHPQFGEAIPCPHCDGAKKPRDHKAEYLAFLRRDKEEIARLQPYREQQAAERRYAPVANDFPDAAPPPDGYAQQIHENAERVPVPFCITPFVIVPKAKDGRRGFVAQWARTSDRAQREDASAWCATKDAVRAMMANRYADVQEVRG